MRATDTLGTPPSVRMRSNPIESNGWASTSFAPASAVWVTAVVGVMTEMSPDAANDPLTDQRRAFARARSSSS